jgi:predicted lipase
VVWAVPAEEQPRLPQVFQMRIYRFQKNAKISHAERAVIYTNPLTGERIVPPRADTPMPQTYVDRGFVRKEITSMSQFEKETGLVHEAVQLPSRQ